MQKHLIISVTKEEKAKQQLKASIERKKKILSQWMEKVETLKMELELIQNEYNVRIGYLLLKDNQLDLEIIQYKNLKRLMDEGMTYEEAVKAEEDAFYSEILRMQKEQERLEEEKSFFEKRQDMSEEIRASIKELWKRLIRKFHPDLVTDQDEKNKREALMKRINTAYAQGDVETLEEMENTIEIQDLEETDKEKLELVLVKTENLIQKAKQDFLDLRDSQWYSWKKRIDSAKKLPTPVDVFADMEKKLLDDVVKKITILRELRSQVNPHAVV